MIDDTAVERFWTKVDRSAGPEGCWLWTAATWKPPSTYGQFPHRGKLLRAHRVSYELAHGPIPEGLVVCHTCDTPRCVNPSHLWVGTNADNTRDRDRKGRHRWRKTKGPITEAMVQRMRDLRQQGWTYAAIAAEVGVSTGVAYRRAYTPREPKATCPKGHPRAGNTLGNRGCATCGRLQSRDYQRRRRAALREGRSWPPA